MTEMIELYENIAVIVPAYNESKQICSVLKRIKKHILSKNIFVIDDGSTDNTADKSIDLGVRVIRHEKNYGKGRALITGLCEILDSDDLSAVITLDGDGQHDPRDIPGFVEKFIKTGADIVIGNRMNNTKGMPLLRRFTNKTTSLVVSGLTGLKIPDSQSGYRLLRTSLLLNMNLNSTHFDTESEILLRAGKAGAKISSVPIRTIYSSEKSKINPLVDTFRFLFLVLRSLFW